MKEIQLKIEVRELIFGYLNEQNVCLGTEGNLAKLGELATYQTKVPLWIIEGTELIGVDYYILNHMSRVIEELTNIAPVLDK